MDVPTVVVVGQIARDLIVLIDEVPGAGEAAGVRSRHEVLGGKGANQAVALTVALLCGDTPERAAQLAVAAATVTVGHAGGRPRLDQGSLRTHLAQIELLTMPQFREWPWP